ncbi:MAG: hypothetical protein ACO3ND_08850 [Opitutales bacterium]
MSRDRERDMRRRGFPGNIKPPPVYVRTKDRYDPINPRVNPEGELKANRKISSYGLPVGKRPARTRILPGLSDYESANRRGEWAVGEFQRSYPKSKNQRWYREHSYGKPYPGAEYDTWRKKAGPPSPVQKAAKRAGARAVGRG